MSLANELYLKIQKEIKNSDQIALVHSNLKASQLNQIWHDVKNGRIKVVIGTQKALFLPFNNLSTVAIHESQISSHKQWDQYPRLHNIRFAKKLASLFGFNLLYTGTKMSIANYHSDQSKTLKVINNESVSLQTKFFNFSFKDRENKKMFPQSFETNLLNWVKWDKKILLLHNVRGSYSLAWCNKCKDSIKCPKCDVSLTAHNNEDIILECHYCGFKQKLIQKCKTCHKKITLRGVGNEKLIDYISDLVPKNIKVLEIDSSSSKARINAINKSQIVLATSTIFSKAKNDFNQVVYLFPEKSAMYPDYRSQERTLSNLFRLKETQSSNKPISVVTRQPDMISELLTGKTSNFYERELKLRKKLNYPPFTDIVKLTVEASSSAQAQKKAHNILKIIKNRGQANPDLKYSLNGPFESFRKKVRGKNQAHLIIQGKLSELLILYTDLPTTTAEIDPERLL